jgi:diaminohydroxyphosphoribosylaminopyrimidine deaminase / 5-amino-6-(5-phosphoribosylamino)uracil reductase
MGLEKIFSHGKDYRGMAPIVDAFGLALAHADKFAGATSPNPPVGCAILDEDGALLACEAHAKAGEPHAEALALHTCRRKGLAYRIHTVVVTLEPCNHLGRTLPCAEAILGTSAKRVVVGNADPNPGVAGGGTARLKEAGLEILFLADLDHPAAATLAAASTRLIGPFAKWANTGRSWITVKQALDETGAMVPPPGAKTFTSDTSLDLAHRLRRRADAIITGSGTVVADAPLFTVRRVPDHPGKRRSLAIIDRRKRTPPAYLESAAMRGFDPFFAPDILSAQQRLGERGCLEALVEAGPGLTGHVEAGGLWDEWITIRKSATADIPDAVSFRYRHDHPNLHPNGN